MSTNKSPRRDSVSPVGNPGRDSERRISGRSGRDSASPGRNSEGHDLGSPDRDSESTITRGQGCPPHPWQIDIFLCTL